MLLETDKAYLACLVDSEGNISLIRYGKRPGPKPTVSIGNTNHDILRWIQCQVGMGNIYIRKQMLSPNHKLGGAWTVSHNEAISFLRIILPYLKMKKRQAEVIFALDKLTKRAKKEIGCKKFGGGKACPDWLNRKRDAAKFLINYLNHKTPMFQFGVKNVH